jgi:SAM-dependent methyltransferase
MTRRILKSRPTGRRLDQILEIHGLPLDIFEGTTVYDLGCGLSDIGADLAIEGVKAVVVGFDKHPQALLPTGRINASQRVEASLDQLPVHDETADIVLATFSFPLFAKSSEEVVRFFSEATRAVRSGGLLSISPTAAHSGLNYEATSSLEERELAIRGEVSRIRNSNWVPLNLDIHDPDTVTARKL